MDFLKQVERLLDMPPAEKDAVLRELRSHYEEIRSQLESEGMDEQQAAAEAEARLGDPTEVALTLNREHCVSSWKTALLSALPFMAAFVDQFLYQTVATPIGYWKGPMLAPCLAPSLLLTAVFLAGSIRELVCGRRPLWLSSWLAAGLVFGLAASRAILLAVVPPSESYLCYSWLLVLSVGLTLAVPIAVCWRVSGWRKFLIPTAALATCCMYALYILLLPLAKGPGATIQYWAYLKVLCAFSFAYYTMYLLFATSVFQSHRFGGPVHATLFIFVFCWLSDGAILVSFGGFIPAILPLALQHTVGAAAAGMALAFLATLAFARASTPRKKPSILAWCALLWGGLVGNIIAFGILATILVYIPLAIHERTRRRELERASSESAGGITT